MARSTSIAALEAAVAAMEGYRPKGPFPLFIKDLKEDTIGWDGAARWRYLCVLEHMFHQGGYIPDDLTYLAEISGMNRARNWRETLEKLRYILLKSEKKHEFLTNKRVLIEVEKAHKRSSIASTGGKARAGKYPAVSTPEAVPPTPTPIVSKEEPPLEGAPPKPPEKPPDDDDAVIPLFCDRSDEALAVRLWNFMAERHGLPVVLKMTDTRKRKLRARLKDCGGLEGWKVALEKVKATPGLRGENDRKWRADIDFLLQEKSWNRLTEGFYDNWRKPGGGAMDDAFDSMEQMVMGDGG